MLSKNELLKDRSILNILIGDTEPMPYLNGPTLCEISTDFGFKKEYGGRGGNPSRWQYMEDLIDHCCKENTISALLGYLFAKNQFKSHVMESSAQAVDEKYRALCNEAIEEINSLLYFHDAELIKTNNVLSVQSIDGQLEVNSSNLTVVDREYIKDITERVSVDIENKDFDSAATKCRTLIEELFCYVIELRGEEPIREGNINKLYGQVKQLYNMHYDPKTDQRIKELLSGLEKIISAITQMRNVHGDAHGQGSKRINISTSHARLLLNTSTTIAEFFLSVAQEKEHSTS